MSTEIESETNDPERQNVQLYRHQNIKEATLFTSASAEVNSVCMSHLNIHYNEEDRQEIILSFSSHLGQSVVKHRNLLVIVRLSR